MPEVATRFTLPGFVNAHSHAFQRALRGRAEGGDFWAWRELMLELAARQTVESVRREYEQTYREMRAAGYTAVGEFHYLGAAEARAAVAAAGAAGIEVVLLLSADARDGRGARPPRRRRRARLRLPHDRSEPRRRVRAGRADLRARDRRLHQLR